MDIDSDTSIHLTPPSQGIQQHAVSDLDQLFFPTSVPYFLIYHLPHSSPHTRRIIANDLLAGLRAALTAFPPLTTHIRRRSPNNRTYLHSAPDDPIPFVVRGIDESPADISDYAALSSKRFPPALLPAARLHALHGGAARSTSPQGSPALAVQLTFIDQGLVIGIQLNHVACDGISHNVFFTHWFGCTRAHSTASPSPPLSPLPSFDRTPLDFASLPISPSADVSALESDLLSRYPLQRLRPPPGTTSTSVRIFHFSSGSAARLKSSIQSEMRDGSWISTQDAVSALLWLTVTRSRLQTGRVRSEDPTRFLSVLNVRSRYRHLPASYFGNGIIWTPSARMSVSSFLAEASLPRAARMIRESLIRDWTSTIDELITYTGLRSDHGKVCWGQAMNNSSDVGATSWRHLQLDGLDFGHGAAQAVRCPQVGAEVCIIFPDAADAGGIDVYLSLDERSMEALEKDPEMTKWAER